MVFMNLVKTVLDNGGTITPILIPSEMSKGTGLCNTSVHYDGEKLRMIVRNVEYTLWHAEGESKYQSRFEGPLSYYHRDDDLKLRTNNFYCEYDKDTMEQVRCNKIDTSMLDVKPIWDFIGLEDARLIKWDGKFWACGVRRDTTPNGQGRMEFSELEIGNDYVKEIKRTRIEAPLNPHSYCEKNWMPVKNNPYHFIKWSNPTELVKVDLDSGTSSVAHQSTPDKYINVPYDLRGGSHLIEWDDNTYLTILHECKFIRKNFNGYKDADYYHRFILWDRDTWEIKLLTEQFNFMTAKTEFAIGLEQVDNNILMVFGFQDNGCYAVKCTKNFMNDLIWKVLKPHS